MANTYSQPILIAAASELEANRKATAITTIAGALSADTLAILAKAAKKPGMDAKVVKYQQFL